MSLQSMNKHPHSNMGTNGPATTQLLDIDAINQQRRRTKQPFSEWPTKPRKIARWRASHFCSVLLDLGLLGLALLFAAFGIAVKLWAGISVEGRPFSLLTHVATLAPTVFPIVFAAITGRALRAIALWRLERGAQVGCLDQLVGSTSLTSTVSTQFKLRALNLLTLGLFVVWALSPLGGQGSIRVLGTAVTQTHTSTGMQALNSTCDAWDEYGNADSVGLFAQPNALFAASLSSPAKIKTSPVDIWGNVKIPILETLNSSTADSEGWTEVTQNNTMYASLIGLPMSSVPSTGNTTLNLETSYWYLTCSPIQQVDNGGYPNVTGWNTTSHLSSTTPGMVLSSDRGFRDYQNISNDDLRQLNYCGWDQESASSANCTMVNSYVEVQVGCDGPTCSISRIRRSRMQHSPPSWTQLDSDSGGFIWYAEPMVTSLGSFHVGFVTPFQGYLMRPEDPFNLQNLGPVWGLSPETLGLRLSQMMNTFWLAMVGSKSVQSGTSNTDFDTTTEVIEGSSQPVTATVEQSHTVIACDDTWLAILLLSTLALTIMSITGIAATLLRCGPELDFTVSSMLTDSSYVKVPEGGSTLDTGDRGRMLKDMQIRFGDVADDEGVGYLTIATMRGDTYPSLVSKDRFYA